MNAIAAALVRADEMGGGELVFVPHEHAATWVATIRRMPDSVAWEVVSETTRSRNANYLQRRAYALESARARAADWIRRERKKLQLTLPLGAP